MTIREKLGQMLMFGFPGKAPDKEALRLIREYGAGNIILFSHNVESVRQVRELCEYLQKEIISATGYPAFIAMDQEGGVVSRMPEDAVNFPSAMAVASTGSPENAYTAGYDTAVELCDMGVNLDLAPCLDLNTNPQNPVIGVRSYGDSPGRAIPYAISMMRGLLDGGVAACAKHFPGHGDTAADSHLGLPRVDKTEEDLFSCELAPFAAAIGEGIPCVMTSHILFPKVERLKVPATMSEAVLKGLLRGRLGFGGLILSDCLEMAAIRNYYGTADGFVKALCSGVNIGCISHSPGIAIEALEKAEQAAKDNIFKRDDIDAGVELIISQKRQYAALKPRSFKAGSMPHREAARSISQKSIVRVGRMDAMPLPDNDAFFTGCVSYRTTLAGSEDRGVNFAEFMAGRFSGQFFVTPINPGKDDISAILDKTYLGQTVVACTYNGHLNPGQPALVNALCENGRRVIAVALRNPYDLPLIDARAYKLAAFEYTPLSMASVELVLRGAPCEGKLNIALE